jgi:hypothetical protein
MGELQDAIKSLTIVIFVLAIGEPNAGEPNADGKLAVLVMRHCPAPIPIYIHGSNAYNSNAESNRCQSSHKMPLICQVVQQWK